MSGDNVRTSYAHMMKTRLASLEANVKIFVLYSCESSKYIPNTFFDWIKAVIARPR